MARRTRFTRCTSRSLRRCHACNLSAASSGSRRAKNLAVVPERERRQAQFIEPAHCPAGRHQFVEMVASQPQRSDRIHDQPHAHPATRRRCGRRPETTTNFRISKGESLHANGRPCRINGAQFGLQQALLRAMPRETVCGGYEDCSPAGGFSAMTRKKMRGVLGTLQEVCGPSPPKMPEARDCHLSRSVLLSTR